MKKQDSVSTWEVVTAITLLVCLAAAVTLMWKYRTPAYATVTEQKINTGKARLKAPSVESEKELIDSMKDLKYVSAVQMVSVDFGANERYSTYFRSSLPVVQAAWDDYQSKKTRNPPLFSADEQANQRLVNIINGKFTCERVEFTSIPKLVPGAVSVTDSLCSISIPPGYGEFVGFINFWVSRPLTQQDIEELELRMKNVSLKMFQRDIIAIDPRGGVILQPS